MKTIEARLKATRTIMQDAKIDALIVPRADEYLGEYVPVHNERLAFLTGFTGSAGLFVLTPERAILFVDGRYTLQAENQCPAPLFEHHHLINDPPLKWLSQTLSGPAVVAVDGRVIPYRFYEQASATFDATDLQLEALTYNPIDQIWEGRPEAPNNPALLLDLNYSGENSAEKRSRVGDTIKNQGADAALIHQLDSIAWLLNIRGDDVPHLPVLLAQAIITQSGDVSLYTDRGKIPEGFEAHVGAGVTVFDETEFSKGLDALGACHAKVLIDHDHTNAFSALHCKRAGCQLIASKDPVELPKAQKNEIEVEGIRKAHLRDGAALTRYLHWLESEVNAKRYHDEGFVSDRLEAFRRDLPELKDLSFSTISAAGSNAAMAHYSHTNGQPAKLAPNTLYLVDSGGQYFDGTTDVTRTVAIDQPRNDHRDMFTRVLKGHIALACAQFPEGIQGHQLDVLARQFLWEIGKDFDHGTGHGVGCYLSVHEGPQRIGKTPLPTAPLLPGMVVSNEPGYYEPNDYGIRCENLMVVVALDSGMLGFETLTFAPFDRNLIDLTLMSEPELNWLNEYHQRVFEKIGPQLPENLRPWLQSATAPL